jgi:OmpA-OmpF porin, OOP family
MRNAYRVCAACACGFGVAAMAQVAPLHIGVTGGHARADVDCAGTSSCDRSDTGTQAFAGVMLAPVFGIELQLHDYGRVRASVTGIDAVIRSSGAGIGVVLVGPLSSAWDVFARVGAARNRAKVRLSGSVSGSVTDSATKPYFGIGTSYRLTPNLALRLQLDGTTFEPAGQKMDASMVSVGAAFHF